MAKATKAAAAATKKYIVISQLEHDGETYGVGEPVEMTEEQAKPLLGNTLQAVAEAAEEKAAP